jgi:hypothetical protein
VTSEEEKQLVVLTAVLRIGGAGTKKAVLDEVEQARLMRFSVRDLELVPTRNEISWRNDLAYVRKHLVVAGYLSGEIWNCWRITEAGKARAAHLAVQASRQTSGFQHIEPQALPILTQMAHAELSDDNALTSETKVEGTPTKHWTVRYERDATLRAAAISLHGTACLGCGFSFEAAYGPIGTGFIEVHHTKPISSLKGPTTVDPANDLIVLCSNCHSIVHRRRHSPLSLVELRSEIAAARGR